MSNKILTTLGREVMAEALAAKTFLAILSRGDPAWDAQWESANPPSPDLGATTVIDPVGWFRPTIVDYVVPDPDGSITTDEGGIYALAEGRSRYLRIRVSVPTGALDGVSVREVGIFANPVFADGVPSGQTVLAEADVESFGDLIQLDYSLPQPFSGGTSYARNFILRV